MALDLASITHLVIVQEGGMFTHLGFPKVCSYTREVEFDSQHQRLILFTQIKTQCTSLAYPMFFIGCVFPNGIYDMEHGYNKAMMYWFTLITTFCIDWVPFYLHSEHMQQFHNQIIDYFEVSLKRH